MLIEAESPFNIAQNNDWISFWGSVLGSILSGGITFVVLKFTIDNENKKREEDKKLIDLQRLEDKRMSVLPYLNYTIVDDKYIEENKILKELSTMLVVYPNGREKIIETGELREIKIDCNFNLLIENLGLGVSMEPRLDKIYYDEITDTQLDRNMTLLSVGDSTIMKFKITYPEEGVCPMTLKIGYFNLIRDYYEQDVVIDFQGSPIFYKDINGIIYKVEMEYKPLILKVHNPIIV